MVLSILLALRPTWAQRLDAYIEPLLHRPFLTSARFQILIALLFTVAAFLFRDRQHFLGDGGMWMSTFELFANNPEQGKVLWIDNLFEGQGLQYMPFSEAFSTLIRFQVFRLAHQTFGLDAGIAHELLSCLAAFPYAILCLRLASIMATNPLNRAALFLLCLTPATTQFYFGYVESYTLLHLAAAAYAFFGLRFLRGGPFWAATLAMVAAVAAHLMVLAILPSWLYLAWRRLDRPLHTWCQSPRIYLPILGSAMVVGLFLYPDFYPYSMGFFTPREEGMYAIFSLDHLALLANALLLLSPFALLWIVHWLTLYLRKGREPQPQQNPRPSVNQDIAFLG
ncbi:MAG: hypothetical protein ACI8P2_003087 [Candidatus Latescibacterota bacterium]